MSEKTVEQPSPDFLVTPGRGRGTPFEPDTFVDCRCANFLAFAAVSYTFIERQSAMQKAGEAEG